MLSLADITCMPQQNYRPHKLTYSLLTGGNTMKRGDVSARPTINMMAEGGVGDKPLQPAWRIFIRYCAEMGHGEIELLKIQDGLPVLAEVVKKKIKFAP